MSTTMTMRLDPRNDGPETGSTGSSDEREVDLVLIGSDNRLVGRCLVGSPPAVVVLRAGPDEPAVAARWFRCTPFRNEDGRNTVIGVEMTPRRGMEAGTRVRMRLDAATGRLAAVGADGDGTASGLDQLFPDHGGRASRAR
jgi:hypothetical protein